MKAQKKATVNLDSHPSLLHVLHFITSISYKKSTRGSNDPSGVIRFSTSQPPNICLAWFSFFLAHEAFLNHLELPTASGLTKSQSQSFRRLLSHPLENFWVYVGPSFSLGALAKADWLPQRPIPSVTGCDNCTSEYGQSFR